MGLLIPARHVKPWCIAAGYLSLTPATSPLVEGRRGYGFFSFKAVVLVEQVVAVLDKVVGPGGWCEVGPACAECGGCALARLFPVDPQLSFRFSEPELISSGK